MVLSTSRWLLLVGVSLPITCQAQQLASTKLNSYVVTQVGDTVRGAVQVPRFVTETGVKVESDGATKTFLPTETRVFATADGRRYRTRRVSFEAEQVNARQAAAAVASRDSVPVFLQELVLGKARLFRLEYHLVADRSPLEYTQYETTFFFLQVPGHPIFRLRAENFRTVLTSVLADCPAVGPIINQCRYDANGLARLVMLYNTTCAASYAPAISLRQSAAASNAAGFIFGVRAGATVGNMQYSNAATPTNEGFGRKMNPTAGVSLQARLPGRLSLVTGLYITARRNQRVATHVVSAGYVNAGDKLVLSQESAVNSVLIPFLVQYALAKKSTPLRPYLAGGLVSGVNLSNTADQTVLTEVFEPQLFKPRQATTVVNAKFGSSRPNPVLGFQVSGGVQPLLGTLPVVAEIYYELGRELGGDSFNGKLTYQSTGLRLGVNF